MGVCHAPLYHSHLVPHSSPKWACHESPLAAACPSSLYQPQGDVGCVPRDVGALSLLGPARTRRRVGLPHRFLQWGWRWVPMSC